MLEKYEDYLDYLELSIRHTKGMRKAKAQLKFMVAMLLPLMAMAMMIGLVYLGVLNGK